jgi:branched-chain amino acid aminotransferase
VTPPLGNLLDGITRDTVIRLARAKNIEVREELFSRDYIFTSDEVFFAGTGAEVTPVVEVDKRKIGDGRRGKLTAAIQKDFFDVVYGRTNQWSEWRTPV